MGYVNRATAALRRLWRQEDGTLTLEFLIMAPIMLWTYVATLAYFDVYRTEAIGEKAAMTVADMLSREPNLVNDGYIDGAYGLLKFLTRNDTAPEMRVSVLRYHDKSSTNVDDSSNHFHLVWSEVRHTGTSGTYNALTSADARALTGKLPKMSDGDRLILVETWTRYNSPYNMGLKTVWGGGPTLLQDGEGNFVQGTNEAVPQIKDIVMTSFIFTAPRFKQTCFNNTPSNENSRKC